MVDFPTQIPGCDSHSPALLARISFSMAFPLSGNCILMLSQFQLTFCQIQEDGLFHYVVQDYSSDWDSLCDHLRDRRISLNSVLLLLLVNFLSGFRLELMNISLNVNIKSSFIQLHVFQLLVLLAQFTETKKKEEEEILFFCTK